MVGQYWPVFLLIHTRTVLQITVNQCESSVTIFGKAEQRTQQVAQLWQRDHMKLDTSSINVQRYLQNHAQNWIFGPPYGGIKSNICTLSKIF